MWLLTAPWEQKQSSLKSPGSLVLFIFFCKLMSYRSFWGHESNLCLVMAERGGKTNRTSLCARADNKMNTALPAHPCPIQTPDRASPCPCQAVRWRRSLWCLLFSQHLVLVVLWVHVLPVPMQGVLLSAGFWSTCVLGVLSLIGNACLPEVLSM